MKKKRRMTRIKLKNSTRAIIILIALVLFAFSSKNIWSGIFDKNEIVMEEEIYNYTNKYNMDYIVNIKENEFIEEESLPKDLTYVSDLIDDLDMKINYEYLASENVNVKYDYKIDAQISASHSDDGTLYEVWNKTYNIKEVKNNSSNQNIRINEEFSVDFDNYHEEVKAFKQELGMSLEAKLYVKLTVNTTANVENKVVNDTYVSDFSISLGEKISKVDGKITDENKEIVTGEKIVEIKENNTLIINIIMLVMSVYVIYYVRNKTHVAYNIKNEFKLELNRILKSCQDRIVIVKNKVEVEGNDIIDVKTFVELIKLSEELFKPILYWMSEENENEAEFYVISNKIAYRFILK